MQYECNYSLCLDYHAVIIILWSQSPENLACKYVLKREPRIYKTIYVVRSLGYGDGCSAHTHPCLVVFLSLKDCEATRMDTTDRVFRSLNNMAMRGWSGGEESCLEIAKDVARLSCRFGLRR